ncbi:putative 50protein in ND4 intron [Trichinella spiralis]|uniref:50protein in ND4 intron n=1 Tax=Trichinella spiralis TaxID=6334 RepID=A0ABR3KBS3_TRISP
MTTVKRYLTEKAHGMIDCLKYDLWLRASVNHACLRLEQEEYQSIDEEIIPYKGRNKLKQSQNPCDRNTGPMSVTMVAGTPCLVNHSRNFSIRAFVIIFIIPTSDDLEYASIAINYCLS